VALYRNLW